MITIVVFLLADAIYAIVLPLIFTDHLGPVILKVLLNVPYLFVPVVYILYSLGLRRDPENLDPDGLTLKESIGGVALFLCILWLGCSGFEDTSSLIWFEKATSKTSLVDGIFEQWHIVTGVFWLDRVLWPLYLSFIVVATISYWKCYVTKKWLPARTGKVLAIAWFSWIVLNGLVSVEARFGLEEFYWLLLADLFRLLCYGLIVIYLTVTFVGPSFSRDKQCHHI